MADGNARAEWQRTAWTLWHLNGWINGPGASLDDFNPTANRLSPEEKKKANDAVIAGFRDSFPNT
jgi:hypothetical protein